MPTLVQNIEALFAEIATFEAGGKEFSTDAFVNNLDGILSAFEMLRNQAEATARVDEALYRKIREADPSRSLLRFGTTNILGMFLDAWARGPTGHLRSSRELEHSRPEGAQYDADFIERVLVPRMLHLSELGGDSRLGLHLLLKSADFLQTFGAPPTFSDRTSRVELERKPIATLLLGFARRHLEFPGQILTERPGALEYGLKREGFFEGTAARGRREGVDAGSYLGLLQLLPRVPWWRRLLKAVGSAFARPGAALKPVFAQLPTGGVFWSGFWILIAVLMIVGVPLFWLLKYDVSVKEFRADGMAAGGKPIAVLGDSAKVTP